jgi:phytoene dehydrogenase-like protein
LIGEEHVDPKIIRRIKNIRYDRHNIFWANFAVHELPEYKATAFDPECGPQPRIYIGPKDPDYLANQYMAEIFTAGLSRQLYLFVGPDSIWDETRAPAGKHVLGVEEISAPTRFFTHNRWQDIKTELETRVIDQWQRYAPNMTRDNLIGSIVYTPYDIEAKLPNMHQGSISVGDMILSQQDRFRPIPEMSNYRTPIKNLYLASAAAHCGIGIGRGSSYCCFQAISADLGLEG